MCRGSQSPYTFTLKVPAKRENDVLESEVAACLPDLRAQWKIWNYVSVRRISGIGQLTDYKEARLKILCRASTKDIGTWENRDNIGQVNLAKYLSGGSWRDLR
jgi:hypothetical protein